MTSGTMSSEKNDWATPKALFSLLDGIFHFTLDPCSNEQNHLCDKYYTVEDDGLIRSWKGERVFMNPPYGADIGYWCEKAKEESMGGCIDSRTCTCTNGYEVVAGQHRGHSGCDLHPWKAQVRRRHTGCSIPICDSALVGKGNH